MSNSHGLAFLNSTVELFNGDVGVLAGLHLDETKTSRLAYVTSTAILRVAAT